MKSTYASIEKFGVSLTFFYLKEMYTLIPQVCIKLIKTF